MIFKKRPLVIKTVTPLQWFWFLAVMGLITRLSYLYTASAETTDGVLSLTYFSPDLVQTPRFVILPGYPFLLWLGEQAGATGWLWGRAVALTAGLLFLIPLWKFCRRWVPEEMSGIICLMALFSPLLWQWSLKVMPDTLFLLVFWWCLERLAAYYVARAESVWWQACLIGAAAALVRPEGFLLFPWILCLGSRSSKGNTWKRLGGLVLGWIAPFYFLSQKLSTLLLAYREGTEKIRFPLVNLIEHLYAYVSQPFYVFTPLLFWFAVLGLAKMARHKGPEGESFKKILMPVYLLLFLSRLLPVTYQDRHMLPFLPLLAVAAGFHLETFFGSLDRKIGPVHRMFWKNGLVVFCLAWLALFSVTSLISQRDSFGDIKRSSEFLASLPQDAVIYSDEVPKTQYWSGRKVVLLPYLSENTPFNPRPGDTVVLHSFYTPRIVFVQQHMINAYGAEILHEDQSVVVPLLTDVMEDSSLQNRTTATAFRFQPQFFRSRVYAIHRQAPRRSR